MSVLDLTQAARLFYGADEVAELWRDGQRLWPFGPDMLGWSGIAGASYYADPATMFSDAGVTPAALGEAVRQINDRAGTGVNGGQSTLANRPLRGRGPRDLRNRLTRTADFNAAAWVDTNATVTRGLSAVDGQPLAARVVPVAGTRALNLDGLRTAGNFLVLAQTTISADFKSDGLPYGMIGLSNGAGLTATVVFDLSTGLVVSSGWHPNAGANLTFDCVALGNGWWRCALTIDTNGLNSVHLTGSTAFGGAYGRDVTGNGTDGVLIARPQVELAAAPSNPQVLTGVVDIAEAGVNSDLGFLRFDATDLIQTTFASGMTGQMLIAGRGGSWLSPVALTAGQALSVGADPLRSYGTETWTGGPYQGLRALGDVIGWTAREGGFSAADLDRLLRDYGRKGASGLLAPTGANLAPNPNFDTDSGWTKSGPGVTRSGGQYTIADVGGADSFIYAQMSGVQPGRSYLVEVAITANSAAGSGFRARIGELSGLSRDGDHFAPPTPFTGLWQFVFVARRLNPLMTFLASNLNLGATIDSVSVRELVAAPIP